SRVTEGRLLLAATPLGQVGDASARLIEALATADVIAAEDTRRIRTLANALEVQPAGRVVSFFDHNEGFPGPQRVEGITAGASGRSSRRSRRARRCWWSVTRGCRSSAIPVTGSSPRVRRPG